MKAEETKRMFRKIRTCRGQVNSSLSSIQIPAHDMDTADCEEWITIDTPLELELKLRERNQKHFGQASGTFPTVPQFSEKIDWGASTHTSDLILDGEFDDSELAETAQQFVQYMKKRTALDSIPAVLTVEEWKKKITVWNESTSMSPSGFH